MDWYKRNLGDYASKTARLSLVEHGVYALLLDEYYASEKPLPADLTEIGNVLADHSPDARAGAGRVLSKYFNHCATGWIPMDAQPFKPPRRRYVSVHYKRQLLAGQAGRCAAPWCRKVIRYLGRGGGHLDHIMPVILGGDDEWYNLQVLCERCNILKGGAHPDVWLAAHT